MKPFDALQKFVKTNPQAGAVLLAGVAALAAVAVVSAWGLDLQSSVPSAMYVIGVGVLLLFVTSIINDQILMKTLRWFGFVALVGWILVFITFLVTEKPSPSLGCLAYFWQSCVHAADAVAANNFQQPQSPPGNQVAPVSPPATGGRIQPERYQVVVQFAVFPRQRVREMMQKLKADGWNVDGVSGGGQRTSLANGYNEVRYGDNADKAAAELLARAVQDSKIVSQVTVVQTPAVRSGNLEIWIS